MGIKLRMFGVWNSSMQFSQQFLVQVDNICEISIYGRPETQWHSRQGDENRDVDLYQVFSNTNQSTLIRRQLTFIRNRTSPI